jgi:hypothetical protein
MMAIEDTAVKIAKVVHEERRALRYLILAIPLKLRHEIKWHWELGEIPHLARPL